LSDAVKAAEKLKNVSDVECATALAQIPDWQLREFLWDLTRPNQPLDKYVAAGVSVDWILRTLAFRTVAHELWRRADVAALEG
jgi:hypothetical protein